MDGDQGDSSSKGEATTFFVSETLRPLSSPLPQPPLLPDLSSKPLAQFTPQAALNPLLAPFIPSEPLVKVDEAPSPKASLNPLATPFVFPTKVDGSPSRVSIGLSSSPHLLPLPLLPERSLNPNLSGSKQEDVQPKALEYERHSQCKCYFFHFKVENL